MKKILALALVLCMALSLCTVSAFADDKIKVGMVTDVGGVNDKSFNQGSWEGLQLSIPKSSRSTTLSPRPMLTTRPTSTPSSTKSTT